MTDTGPVALLTGAARRIGAEIARTLHHNGFHVIVHYCDSKDDADALVTDLNRHRPDSALALQADLAHMDELERLARAAEAHWGQLDALVHNASTFYPTPVGETTERQWDDLMSSNLKAPFFLSQALAPALRRQRGSIVSLIDVHAERPLKNHPVYCAAKAGHAMLTRSLARELAPDVRVNGIAPGAILWPEQQAALDEQSKAGILERVPLNRPGEPSDIATTVLFLLTQAPYITGQILAVDGGRSIH